MNFIGFLSRGSEPRLLELPLIAAEQSVRWRNQYFALLGDKYLD
jgi:hypothetical protein